MGSTDGLPGWTARFFVSTDGFILQTEGLLGSSDGCVAGAKRLVASPKGSSRRPMLSLDGAGRPRRWTSVSRRHSFQRIGRDVGEVLDHLGALAPRRRVCLELLFRREPEVRGREGI